jgi:hypothetical protein
VALQGANRLAEWRDGHDRERSTPGITGCEEETFILLSVPERYGKLQTATKPDQEELRKCHRTPEVGGP